MGSTAFGRWVQARLDKMSRVVGPFAAHKYDSDLPTGGGADWIARATRSRKLRRRFPTLRTSVSGAAPEVRPFLPEEPLDLAWTDEFDGTAVNTIGLRDRRRPALSFVTLRDVCLYFDRRGVCLFHRDGVSSCSPSLPLFDVTRARPDIRISHGHLCGDNFTVDNICHFTLDHLGRAILAQGQGGMPLFYASRFDYVDAVRRRCLGDTPHAALLPGRVYHFDRLDLLSNVSHDVSHPARYCDPRILGPLRAAVLQDLPKVTSGERIYVSRSDARGRRILNEAEFLPRLKQLGFEVVTMSGRSGAEQLAMFRQARCIVAPHGAALTSLIACAPGTRVVEVFTPENGTAAYTALSGALGLSYKALFGTPGGKKQDYSLDPDLLLGALGDR